MSSHLNIMVKFFIREKAKKKEEYCSSFFFIYNMLH
nr:MAG TPA: hypothetical protein [Crassvirales sp.]